MALNAFQFTGGANVSVQPTPNAVQVTGPTIYVTNVGQATVYGSLSSGSASNNGFNPGNYLSGAPIGAPSASFGNTATGVGGIAIAPGDSVPITVGSNAYLWLATLQGNGSINVANGS